MLSKISKVVKPFKELHRAIQATFNDYSDHCTIHGVNYVAEKNRSWFERIFWIASICISMVGCGKLLLNAWNINPIIISFTDKPTSIQEVSLVLQLIVFVLLLCSSSDTISIGYHLSKSNSSLKLYRFYWFFLRPRWWWYFVGNLAGESVSFCNLQQSLQKVTQIF